MLQFHYSVKWLFICQKIRFCLNMEFSSSVDITRYVKAALYMWHSKTRVTFILTNPSTLAFNLATRVFSLLTRGFELETRGFELVTLGFELVTREFELVTRGFELVARVLLFHLIYSPPFHSLLFLVNNRECDTVKLINRDTGQWGKGNYSPHQIKASCVSGAKILWMRYTSAFQVHLLRPTRNIFGGKFVTWVMFLAASREYILYNVE